ncbi:MAG: 2-isopropylmalate synthase, partial [Myxococcales bacterium]|nr:2-isopropylmalate synthase [Myxococcales bacterium]
GKGGVGYLLETNFGVKLPRELLVELGRRVQEESERTGAEVSPESVFALYEAEYSNRGPAPRPRLGD